MSLVKYIIIFCLRQRFSIYNYNLFIKSCNINEYYIRIVDEFNKIVDYERNDNDCIDNWKYNDFAVNVSISKIWNRKKKEK